MGKSFVLHGGQVLDVTPPPPQHEQFKVSLTYFGSGLYTFSVPKDRQARYVEEGLRKFREYAYSAEIASMVIVEGYTRDMSTVFIVCNPPYESTNVG